MEFYWGYCSIVLGTEAIEQIRLLCLISEEANTNGRMFFHNNDCFLCNKTMFAVLISIVLQHVGMHEHINFNTLYGSALDLVLIEDLKFHVLLV